MEHEQFTVMQVVDEDDPLRVADIVLATEILPGTADGGIALRVSVRVQSVAWAGGGEASFSDVQWLDDLRAALASSMGVR